MGVHNFRLVILWYLLPFLYLAVIEGVVLPQVSTILALFFAGLCAGYYSFHKARSGQVIHYAWLDRFFQVVFILAVVVQGYGFFRVLSDGFDLTRYRMDFYEATGGIFRNTYLFTLYNVFLMPLLLVAVMYWLNKDLKRKQVKRLITFAFLIIVFDAVLRLGRFQYLYILFFFYLSYKAFGFKRLAIFVMLGLAVVVSFLTIYFRQFFVDSAVESAVDIANAEVFRNSIVSYQYNGYIFLEHLLQDKDIFGRPWEMNTPSFGYLFLKTVTTKFGIDFNYPWEQYNIILTEGMLYRPLNLYFNAFATNFLPIYLDFGITGIFLYGVFAGAFIGIRTGNILLRTLQYLNLFILIFGLYQPIITTLPGFLLLIGYGFAVIYMIRVARRAPLRSELTKEGARA